MSCSPAHILYLSPHILPSPPPPTASLREKLLFIIQATYQHARNLALFTTVYKVLTIALQRLWGRGHPLHNFAAGFVGGYLVFGAENKINMQVRVN